MLLIQATVFIFFTLWTLIQCSESITILDTIKEDDRLKEVWKLLNEMELAEVYEQFETTKDITVFLPVNEGVEPRHKDRQNIFSVSILMYLHILPEPVSLGNFPKKEFKHTQLLPIEGIVILPKGNSQVIGIVPNNQTDSLSIIDGNPFQPVKVLEKDIECSNGKINLIEKFLQMPRPLDLALDHVDEEEVGIIKNHILQGNLLETLIAISGLTLFLPTNEAFNAKNITLSKDQIRDYVLAHTISGRALYSTSISQENTYTSLHGMKLNITHNGDQIMVNNATIVKSDYLLANGVIHYIDQVLIPDGKAKSASISPSFSYSSVFFILLLTLFLL